MDKFESILNAFSNGYNPACTAYLELLISHLQKKENSNILQAPYVLKWVLSCLQKLEVDFSCFEPNILAFIIKLSALLTSNEWLVVHLRDEKLLDRFNTLFKINQYELPHCVKLAHIRLLKAVSNYSLGIGWIRCTRPWEFLINYCHRNHTIYVVRESKAVLFDILYKFSVKLSDEKMCIEIIGEILKPINDNVFPNNNVNIVIVDDNAIEQKIGPALDLISYIFEKTLESEEKTSIVHICEEVFQLELNIWKIAGMSTNTNFIEKVLRCLSTLNFARLVYEKWTMGKISNTDFNVFGVSFFNIMKFCVARRAYTNFLRMAEFNHILWKKLGSRAPDQIMIENEKIEFENQLIMFHLLPVLFISEFSCKEEFLDTFIMKLFSISCEFTHRICYGFRDILFDCKDKVPDLAYKSIHEMLSMESILDKNRSVLIFQALCYALKEFVMAYNDQEEGVQKSKADYQMCTPNVLHAVLVGAQSLIEKYNISWNDSLETICITNFTQMIIDNPNVNSRLAVQAIKLTQVSIEHFLAPNMALLMDDLKGSGLQKLGPIIKKRLLDKEWEVRDSAIELITSIAEISHTKFPVFQNYLVEHEIPPFIYKISQNDGETYVRESAYRCISHMVNIDCIWENSIKKLDIGKEILNAISTEQEGIVRKEIVSLLTAMYENGRFPAENPLLFSVMCDCAVNDLHWEVKVQAMKFWTSEIRRHFTNQGMIDGTFPQVTFSKEKKKIVTLTDTEIVLRIDKILSDLSSCGCLAVLVHCLNDQCDIEVVKVTVALTKKLFNCFHKYDYINKMSAKNKVSLNSGSNTNEQMSVDDSMIIDKSPTIDLKTMESVIDSITSTDDINLLAFNYQNQLNGESSSEARNVDVNYYKEFAKISPLEFINKVKVIDIDNLVSTKDDWMKETESFNSLLDDIVYAVEGFKASVDCY